MVKKNSKARALANAVSKAKTTMDGWRNVLTGLGQKGSDKREASKIEWQVMHEADAEELFAGSDVARKITCEVVDESFREGYILKADSLKDDIKKQMTDEGQRLGVDHKLSEAWALARMQGGAVVIPVPRDLKLLEKPFIPQANPIIENLLVLSRWELPHQELEYDIRNPNFGRPQSFRVAPRSGASQGFEQVVHNSWLIRFDGAYLPRQTFVKNNYWMDSYLNTCKTAIRDYDNALAAVSYALDDFSVGVMKVKDLSRSISEDRDDLIQKKLSITNMSRSVARMIILDADSETYEFKDRTLSGVSDCVKTIAGRLVVASNMPHTKILGESPQGSNATGNSTTKDWYDYVASQQKKYLNDRLIRLWTWILSAKLGPTKGIVPAGLNAVFAPLWQEPESTQAAAYYQRAQGDAVYISNGVAEPAEVAISRFGSGEYNPTTIQLVDDRKQMADDQVEKANNPDDPSQDPAIIGKDNPNAPQNPNNKPAPGGKPLPNGKAKPGTVRRQPGLEQAS